MDNKEHIQAVTNYIFNYNFSDNDIPEKVEAEYYDRASALLDEYSWNDIFKSYFFSAVKPTGLPVGGTAFNLPFFVL